MQCHTSSRLIFPPTFDTHRDRAGGGAGVRAGNDVVAGQRVLDDDGLAAGDGGVGARAPRADVGVARADGGGAVGGELDLVVGRAAAADGVAGDVAGHAGGHAVRDLAGKNGRPDRGRSFY